MPLASFDPASGTESSYQGDFVIFSYAMESVFIGCLVSEEEKRIAIEGGPQETRRSGSAFDIVALERPALGPARHRQREVVEQEKCWHKAIFLYNPPVG
jgi:hypothetical protein